MFELFFLKFLLKGNRATQNFIKNKIWENCKTIQNVVTGREKCRFGWFIWKLSNKFYCFGSCGTSTLTFLQFSQKCAWVYWPFWSFCLLWNSFFSIIEKLYISAFYKWIILFFSVNLPEIFIYKFCRKENLIQPPGEHQKFNLLNFNNESQNLDSISLFIN